MNCAPSTLRRAHGPERKILRPRAHHKNVRLSSVFADHKIFVVKLFFAPSLAAPGEGSCPLCPAPVVSSLAAAAAAEAAAASHS